MDNMLKGVDRRKGKRGPWERERNIGLHGGSGTPKSSPKKEGKKQGKEQVFGAIDIGNNEGTGQKVGGERKNAKLKEGKSGQGV